MINMEGLQSKKILEQIIDMATYLKENYGDVWMLYHQEKADILIKMPSLGLENIDNLLFIQRRAINRVYNIYAERLTK